MKEFLADLLIAIIVAFCKNSLADVFIPSELDLSSVFLYGMEMT